MSAHDPLPAVYQVWQNIKTRNLYIVLLMANMKVETIDMLPSVVYMDLHKDVWVRPLREWYEKFDYIKDSE